MLQKARALAGEKGGECLADSWKNVRTPIKWKCSTGHEWETTYEKVAYAKTWCRQCASETRAQVQREKAYDIMIETALRHDLRCETAKEDYINVLQQVRWTCLLCDNHFSTAWKSLSSMSKFSCWPCDARKRIQEARKAERLAEIVEHARLAECARLAEIQRCTEITRLARNAEQAIISKIRAKDMDELLSRDPPRYSKTQIRMDGIRMSLNRSSCCSSCQDRLEGYNIGLCTSCSAREGVNSLSF